MPEDDYSPIAAFFQWVEETVEEIDTLFDDDDEPDYPDEIILKKDGTPDMRYKINKELFGEEEYVPSPEVLAGYKPDYADEVEEEEEEEEEQWYAYFTSLDGGYWGTEWMSSVEEVYYSPFQGREYDAEDRIVEEYGSRYYGGQGEEILGSAYEEKVSKADVDEDYIL